jgi:hypothetical protein
VLVFVEAVFAWFLRVYVEKLKSNGECPQQQKGYAKNRRKEGNVLMGLMG